MSFFPFLKSDFAPHSCGAKSDFKKGKIGCEVDVTQGGSRFAPLLG
jgi:hypothetical protein